MERQKSGGSNLALNIREKGNKIAVLNHTPKKADEFYESAGDANCNECIKGKQRVEL